MRKDVKESVDQFGRELLIVLRDLERRFEETLEKAKAAPSVEEKRKISKQVLDVLEQVRYFYFELRARGGEDWLKEKFDKYVSIISTALKVEDNPSGKVVDLGCGNGLFLTCMQKAGYDAFGVDTNAAMLASAKERGISAAQSDALTFLREQEDAQIDIITAMEFIEHLPRDVLVEFVTEVNRCLKPGGVLLFETLNAKTFAAYKWFYMDLTHQWLILPETLQVLLETQGFDVVLTDYLSPVSDWDRLQVEDDSPDAANMNLLNEAVFGMQEYYCVARKPVR
jgi:O-antigen chain-terminating methyltransferase